MNHRLEEHKERIKERIGDLWIVKDENEFRLLFLLHENKLKKFWHHASLKSEENLFVHIGYLIMYAGISLLSLFMLEEFIRLRIKLWGTVTFVTLIFVYSFSLFISIVTRLQERKKKNG